MTAAGIPGAGPGGVLRMTWVQDRLAHVLEHSDVGEPSGTWTGLACPDHGLAAGADVDTATLRRLPGRGPLVGLAWEAPADLAARHAQLFQAAIRAYEDGQAEAAERFWQQAHTLWSQARAATCAALGLVQQAGVTPGSLRSSRSAGSWPPSSITAARTASRARTTSSSRA